MDPLLKDERFLYFIKSSNLILLYMDKSGIIKFITPSATQITGISENDYLSPLNSTVFAKEYPGQTKKIINSIKNIENIILSEDKMKKSILQKHQVEFELLGLNNIYYQAVIRMIPTLNYDFNGVLVVFYDISKRKSIESALEIDKEKYRLIAELMDSALWEYDIQKKTLKQYKKLKGKYSESMLNIKDFRNTILKYGWVFPDDIPIFEAYCDSMDRGEDKINYDLRGLSDSGEFIWTRYQGTALRDADGKVRTIMGRTINIDREHKDHEKLIQKTERDPLTGLYNRASAKEKAEQCFERYIQENSNDQYSFMIIDIDDFKQANDQWGHLFGDVLLETFSKQMEELFESTDIVGRIGGDEFVVIQRDIKNQEQIEESAKSICNIARKHMNSGDGSNFTVSVGIAIYPKDGSNYDTLYKNADTALYFSKSLGKDQYAFYDLQMEELKNKNDGSNWITVNTIEKGTPDIERRLLNFAFDIVNESTDVENTIKHILNETGIYYDLSRIAVFENATGNTKASISYEWLNHGVKSLQPTSVDDDSPVMREFLEVFKDKAVFYFNDLREEDFCPEFKQYYNEIGTKALIQCAFYDGTQFMGTISYEDRIAARKWSKTERDTLFMMTKLIGSYIIHMKNKQELDIEMFFTRATLDNQKLSNYAVRKGSYELLYFSEYTKFLFPEAKVGQLCHKALYNQEDPCETCPLKGLDETNKEYSVDTYHQDTDTWFSTTVTSETLPNGENINLVCSADVTSFIERVTSKDALTGLLTLSKFEVYATKLLNNAPNTKYLIIYSDFDKFKNINDELGYSIGNEVLIEYAETANRYVKPNELFCRITADKFVMLLAYKSRMDALERIKASYTGISAAFKDKYARINPVITSGIYFLKPEDKNISIALDKANLARKTIKGIHKSAYAIYDESLHKHVMMEKIITGSMYEALKNGEFVVYMQPKIDLMTSKIIGAEALVRWIQPSGEIRCPSDFLPTLEKNGFIDVLDFYVYEKTLQTLRQWLDMGKRELIVSVNVSRIHLKDADFINRLEKLLEKYKIPSRLIELEITESMFFVEMERLEYIINSLRSRGFLISIDDFGSGYSSLNMLKTLPIDILKLDRDFFMKNEMGSHDKIIISSIISLAKGLGLKVISEGVETLEQLSFLKENSCDMAQGYLFYKPMPTDEFVQLLE